MDGMFHRWVWCYRLPTPPREAHRRFTRSGRPIRKNTLNHSNSLTVPTPWNFGVSTKPETKRSSISCHLKLIPLSRLSRSPPLREGGSLQAVNQLLLFPERKDLKFTTLLMVASQLSIPNL